MTKDWNCFFFGFVTFIDSNQIFLAAHDVKHIYFNICCIKNFIQIKLFLDYSLSAINQVIKYQKDVLYQF